MSADCLQRLSRNERRIALSNEARARRSGNWGEWEKLTFPAGSVGGCRWTAEITTAFRNKVFSVLVRDAGGGVTHYAVSSLSEERPSWWEMQRIKNELAGTEATAVEVYPPTSEVVDGANMFHFWVIHGRLPFSLSRPSNGSLNFSNEPERDGVSLKPDTSSQPASEAGKLSTDTGEVA
jgi:hypothetical protein